MLSQAGLISAVGAVNLDFIDLAFVEPFISGLSVLAVAGLLLLAPLALVAAVGFFRLWRAAWVIGIGLQGLSLLVILILYFYSNVRPGYLYAGMLYHIMTILYLNSPAVKAVFRVGGRDEF